MNIIHRIKERQKHIMEVRESFDSKHAFFEEKGQVPFRSEVRVKDDFEVVARGGTVFLIICILLRVGVIFLG